MIKKVTSIDFGSTNSQIAQCYQKSADGKVWQIEKKLSNTADYLVQEGGDFNIPTIIVTKDDVPENLKNQIDLGSEGILVGEKAKKCFLDNKGIKARVEFKKDFFCSGEDLRNPDKKKTFDEACESIEIFLRFLKAMEDKAPKYNFNGQQIEKETIITVPIRATATERDKMRELAEKAGWENVTIHDEARAVLRYALIAPDSLLRQRVENLTVHQKISALIVDIGGSTTDILLVEINPDGEGGFSANVLGQWPEIGEKNTLGGIDIDKKIYEWFEKKNYLLPSLVSKEIESHGYNAFRKFKELSTFALNNNADAPDVSELNNLYFDKQTFEHVDVPYPKNGAISPEVFLNDIAGEYFQNLQTAIRSLLVSCNFEEENIDCVVASGGGACMFGVSRLLKGEPLASIKNPFNFKQIQSNPKMYIENKEISSALCAIGSALPLPKINFKNHCPCDYFFKLNIYRTTPSNAEGWDKTFYAPPEIPSYFKTSIDKVKSPFALTNESLPLKKTKNYSRRLFAEDGDVFVYIISVWSQSKEDEPHFQKAWSSYSRRTLGNYLTQGAKSAANVAIKVINFVTEVSPVLPSADIEEFDDYKFVSAEIEINTQVKDNFMIEISPSIKIEGQWAFKEGVRTANG